MLRGKDVQEFMEMKRAGLSIQAISELTGYDRKTVRKHLLEPQPVPSYGPREVDHPFRLLRHSTLSFAFASAFVCHCMLLGRSAPPRLSGTTWSITYPGQAPEALPVGWARMRALKVARCCAAPLDLS